MDYLQIIVLGAVQGVTEFLPVSSDGHLVVAGELFRLTTDKPLSQPDLLVSVILHLGTLLSILVFYWRPLARLLAEDRRVLGLLLVGSIPAAIVGLVLEEMFADWMVNPPLTGALLMLNGLMLLQIPKCSPGTLEYTRLTYRQVLLIGLAQAAAPLPGISRSGTTILAGLALGLRRDQAATFSFLLAVPAVGGAVSLALLKLALHPHPPAAAGPLALGVVVSFIVGCVALRLLLSWLGKGRLHYFGYWCLAIGGAVLGWEWLA